MRADASSGNESTAPNVRFSVMQRYDRAPAACTRCNGKKVKCDASTGKTCSRCALHGTECVLIDSKRGKYPRKRRKTVNNDGATMGSLPALKRSKATPGSHDEDRGAVQLSESGKQIWLSEDCPSAASAELTDDSPEEMLYAQIAEQGVDRPQRPITDPNSSVFLGEAFSLTYVVHHVLAPFLSNTQVSGKRLHFPIAQARIEADEADKEGARISRQTKELRERGLYYKPPPSSLEQLLNLYFVWFHPAFPVVDSVDFVHKALEDQVSLVVLNSMLLVAITMCSSIDLEAAGFNDRYAARGTFYQQAKALYDADLETNKIDNIIATFLMSFWWAGPGDQKDSWYWLGIASNLAQSLGMHRSTAWSGMDTTVRKHWRRLWWSIKTRDTLVSGSIGRPQHMSERDSDVEILERDDVAEDDDSTSDAASLYASQMAKLSKIFDKIITCRYAAPQFASADPKREKLERELEQSKDSIPEALKYEGIDDSPHQGLWSAMLLIAYDYATILLCRPPRSSDDGDSAKLWGNRSKAHAAANEVTRIVEDILTADVVRLCQIHTIPALFNALAMHLLTIWTSNPVARELAENRARVCMLGLAGLQEGWPVGGWVLKLFVRIIQRLKLTLAIKKSKADANIFSRPDSSDESLECSIPPNSASLSLTPNIQLDRYHSQQTPDNLSTQGEPSWTELAPLEGSSFSFAQSFPMPPGDGMPNLFVLDDAFQGQMLDHQDFFDLLDVPNL